MCEFFDAFWQSALMALLFFSIMVVLARLKYSARGVPLWLAALMLWGSGVVGLTLLVWMGLGFVCVGSPGAPQAIVPN